MMSSQILQHKAEATSYFNLIKENKTLRNENAQLKAGKFNSSSSFKYQKLSFKNNYQVIGSKIINNSINFSKNYITIDIGNKDGVNNGMGVVGETGIIGIIKSTSDNFSTVTSLLHTKFRTSVKVGKDRTLCSLNWDGGNYKNCQILYLPKHVNVQKGDTVYTSGYGGIFPEEIVVGIISFIETKEDQSFHNLELTLVNDFSKTDNAYVVIDKNKGEKDILIQEEDNE